MKPTWTGVMPAVTTPFRADGAVDYAFFAQHARWLLAHGCSGLILCGSLGEGATLETEEKLQLLETALEAVGDQAPVILSLSGLSTQQVIQLARQGQAQGAHGFMLLPPYVYRPDEREARQYVMSILDAVDRPVMLYNNPGAYGTDFVPEMIAELAQRFPQLEAVKESSGDVRRITALRALLGDSIRLLVGIDDLVVEGVRSGASGWVAGLANALPRESVVLFTRARSGAPLEGLYRWFLPLLRLDTHPKFVQAIKLVQEIIGMGSARVRPPRLELSETERRTVWELVQRALSTRARLMEEISG
ncbi:MAG: dihydrodipicolinate synthase family protein [Bacteroidetes bacterium]|nr:dihydrodipicolinate synthase family protein [Rhodothermia bacterium]MCX7905913.1 dihydrodipicolinate synthase family protein [Bacteroidota bacterium]MDW8138120.1 dihydrodipicolinate synthase family protein [Bacteroidota bacterium]MDW8285804.1 dihydrodipicolinate synthase family protein [Bacteroidota bacterium]